MKTKEAASIKKQTVIVKDLKTKKNPKGGTAGTPIQDTPVGLEGDPGSLRATGRRQYQPLIIRK